MRQFSTYFFFFFKFSSIKKHKQANIKQQKQQFFCAQKLHKRENCLVAFFYAAKCSLKKINWWKIVLIASFTILLMCTPFNHSIDNYFLPNLAPIFLTTFTYFYFCAPILSVRTSFYS